MVDLLNPDRTDFVISPVRSRWLAALAASLCLVVGAEAGGLRFDRLSIEEGLSQSIVEAIVQDDKGFLWFATEDGLNRYDGYVFTVFKNVPGDPQSLGYSDIKALHVDSAGTLWVGSFEGGLNSLDLVTERFTRFRHDSSDPTSLAADTVRSILADDQGSIWVGTQGGGLDRLDPATGEFHHHRHDPLDPTSLGGNDVRSLVLDGQGALWVGTLDGGLSRLDLESGQFTTFRHDPSDPRSLGQDRVKALWEDSFGILWVGTDGGGLCRMDGAEGAFTCFRHEPGDPSSIPSDRVRAVCEDHGGTLWVGTDGGGLSRFQRVDETFTTDRHDSRDVHSLSVDRVFSLFEDRSNVLWVGTYGGGVNAVEVGREHFRHVRHDPENPNSLSHDIVWSIYEDQDGVVWVGTDSGGLDALDRRTGTCRHHSHDPSDGSTLASDTVRVVFEDREGRLWVGTHGGGLDRLDRRTGTFVHHRHDPEDPASLAHDELRSIMQDRSGSLWVGTFGGGLDRLDPVTGSFTHYRNDPEDPTSLSNDFVRTVLEDDRGWLWVGTQGGGLNLLDPASGRCTRYRADPENPVGLSNDYVFALHLDTQGRLWVGTFGGGLDLLDLESGRFRHLTTADGLSNDSVYGILEDDRGALWISTNMGLSRLDPATMTFRNYDAHDGLQSNEFNGGSYHRGRSGELFFGGINGFNSFFPDEIRGNRKVPPVVVTDFRLSNRSIRVGREADGRELLQRSIAYTESLELSHRDDLVSFEFAALHYVSPDRNRYAYQLSGLSEEWIETDAGRRYATFTDLAPGGYVFRAKGANSDGVWNKRPVEIAIRVRPPFWATWWFRLLAALAVAALAAGAHRARTRLVRLRAELHAARDAQMALMPIGPPQHDHYEVAGRCLPAHAVGGDFFDWFGSGGGEQRLCVAVCDISGKGMPAAMMAVMCNGMLAARAEEGEPIDRLLTGLNLSVHRKSEPRSFAALCLLALDGDGAGLEVANAGMCEPLLRRGGAVRPLGSPGARFPLGAYGDTRYESGRHDLQPGDVILVHSDGIPEARNGAEQLYGYRALEDSLAGLGVAAMSAEQIRDAVLDELGRFTGGADQQDDITLVVVKVR